MKYISLQNLGLQEFPTFTMSSKSFSFSANAKVFRPSVTTVSERYEYSFSDFPPLGCEKIPEISSHEKKGITCGERNAYQKNMRLLNLKLEESQETIRRLQHRSTWLEGGKNTLKKKLEGEKSSLSDKINNLQKEITEGLERQESLQEQLDEAFKTISEYREQNSDLKESNNYLSRINTRNRIDLDDLSRERRRHIERIDELRNDLIQARRETDRARGETGVDDIWIDRTIKLHWLFGMAKDSGAFRDDHAEWVLPMVEDIEFPNGENTQSIFSSVPYHIRRRALPSFEDSHFESDGGNEEQIERLAELSREAAEYSALLGDNPEQTINSAIMIQKIFRGFKVRKFQNQVLGRTIEERNLRNLMATKIQKIYRRYCAKIYFHSREAIMRIRSQRNYGTGIRNLDRRGIRFINTHIGEVTVSWMKPDGSFSNPIHLRGYDYVGSGISSFVSHCFIIRDRRGNWEKFFRIPYHFKSNTCVDVSTGYTFSIQFWTIRRQSGIIASRTGIRSVPFPPTEERNVDICNCERCRERRQEERDEEMLQLAIQLSLEEHQDQPVPETLTEDSPDYGDAIDSLFN
jgi:hypothetical protein